MIQKPFISPVALARLMRSESRHRKLHPAFTKGNIMEKLTYEAYCTNPAVREEIEERVRELRREAVREYLVAPLASLYGRAMAALHVRASAPSVKTV
jgi:hypothetical protein